MQKKYFAALAAAGALAAVGASPAVAAVTFDPSCSFAPTANIGACGFVGKGDVQLALGLNNAQMQAKANSLSFSYSQPAQQTATQTATQDGTQTATQSATRYVSCTIQGKKKTFYNEGTRTGERTAKRKGTRSGSRTGVVSGTVSSAVTYDARVKNQVTGYRLTGANGQWAPAGDVVWDGDGSFAFGDWEFDGDLTLGNVVYGPWVSEPGENPSDCLGGSPAVTELVDETTYGDVVTETKTKDIVPGAVSYGPVTTTGPAVLSVNGKALA